MKVCFTGPLLDFSGFAHAARGMLQSLIHAGVDLVARPLRYDSGEGFEVNAELKELLEKPLTGIDVLIQCTTANVEAQPKPGILNGLYTFLEYDRVPVSWAEKVRQFDFIIVPCMANANALMRCGCDKPILVMTTAFDTNVYDDSHEPFVIQKSGGRTIFYNICQLSAKKGLDLLLRSYYAAFADCQDEVLLVLKTYINMSNRQNEREQIKSFIDQVKAGCNIPIETFPPVKVVTEILDDAGIHGLHAAGHAYVNPSRAEGFCIPAFEAMAHGNVLISSMVGGMAEYASPETALVVNAQAMNVYDMQGHDPQLCNGVARWFEPSTAEMADVMRSYHLLRKGAAEGTLTPENEDKWQQIEIRRNAGKQLSKKFDYRITGPKLKNQLEHAFKSWSETGNVEFGD